MFTWESTRELNHTSVHCVTSASANPAVCRRINAACTATKDLMTATTAERRLKTAKFWSRTFVFTPAQSRTHVDTVRNALHGLSNCRPICWSHTMMAIGSFATFAARNSPRVLTLRNTCSTIMRIWSRMFAANVPGVLAKQRNWNCIIRKYTWMPNASAVVRVENFTSVNITLWDTSIAVLLSCHLGKGRVMAVNGTPSATAGCHLSHSITYHPTQVNIPRLNSRRRPALDLLQARYVVLVVHRFGVGLVIERSLVRLPVSALQVN